MFRDILASLMTRVKGARWALVVGLDGVLLEAKGLHSAGDHETLAAEYAVLFRTCQQVTTATDSGELRSSVLFTSQGKVVYQSLSPEYFLLMGLDHDGHTGIARYEISRAQGLLERELVSEPG